MINSLKFYPFLFFVSLSLFFTACSGDKSEINQVRLPNFPAVTQPGQLPPQEPPEGSTTGGPTTGTPSLGGPEVFVPGGPEPEIRRVPPSEPPAEPPPGEEPPSEPPPPATPPSEIISREGTRDLSISQCFDFAVREISDSDSIPMVVYEQRLSSSRRKLVYAERTGDVWRPREVTTVDGVSGECFFRPSLYVDEEGGELYIAAKGVGNRLKLFTRPAGSADWIEPTSYESEVSTSNIDIKRVNGVLKMVYREANAHARIACYSSASPVGCTRRMDVVILDTQAHLFLLPWLCPRGVCNADTACEKVVRFRGSFESVEDVLLLKFCGERSEPPLVELNISGSAIRHPFLTMGPRDGRFTVVYTQPPGNLIRYLQFDADGNSIPGSFENVGATGGYPSMEIRSEGIAVISYTFQNKLRLLKRDAEGHWRNSVMAEGVQMSFERSSLVKFAPVGGVLHTHIAYVTYDRGQNLSLRYIVVP